MSQPHVLIIEDEEHIVELIKFNLEATDTRYHTHLTDEMVLNVLKWKSRIWFCWI